MASFALQASDAKEDSGTQNVTLNLSAAPTWAITLNFTEGGTTTPGRHYGPLSGKVSVTAGATTATIPVQIIDDSVDDDGETIVLTLIAGKGYTVGTSDTHTLTIRNEPAVPTVTVARKAGTTSSVTEGDSASFTVTASPAPAADLEVTLAVADDATSDFLASDDEGKKTVTIAASQTSAELTVPTQDDSANEADGSVTATVQTGSGYTPSDTNGSASVAVSDDDDPTLSVTMAPASASEGDTGNNAYATVTFGLDPVRGEATVFKACLKNTGTAVRGSSGDYRFVNANSDTPLTLTNDCHSYTLAANTASGTVRLLVRGDADVEPDETVVVELKDPPAGWWFPGRRERRPTPSSMTIPARPRACRPNSAPMSRAMRARPGASRRTM